MAKNNAKLLPKTKRHFRLRKKISGTSDRPRLCVYRSNMHISAQLIDDKAGKTIASASTYESSIRKPGNNGNIESATKVGKLLAERAKAAGVTKAVFDRGGNRYHGRVAALADAVREDGLEF